MSHFYCHDSSYVDEGAEVGEGTKIWHFSHVQGGARIGKGCSIGQNVNIGSKGVVGDFVKIQNNVSIYDNVILEDYVFCGPSMVFTNVINPRSHINRKSEYKSTLVKQGSTLGANSTILCGITLGKYCFVGAGAVVTKDVPDYALMVGNPAKQTGWMCSCGIKLPKGENPVCGVCGAEYVLAGNRLSPREKVLS
ncbi:MAG: acyltransferase [Candidatus Eremiobacteraeota bacterium]|nr:acyltransferase [Candidatus Eremiobacteraeota bacterium]